MPSAEILISKSSILGAFGGQKTYLNYFHIFKLSKSSNLLKGNIQGKPKSSVLLN